MQTPATGEKKKRRSSNPMGIWLIIISIVSGIFGIFCALQIRPESIGNDIWYIPPILGIILLILGIWLMIKENRLIEILSAIMLTLLGIVFLGYTVFSIIALISGSSKYSGGPLVISAFSFAWMLFLLKEARDFFR
jgi:uncharacterized membrane protein SirB2